MDELRFEFKILDLGFKFILLSFFFILDWERLIVRIVFDIVKCFYFKNVFRDIFSLFYCLEIENRIKYLIRLWVVYLFKVFVSM